jgi:hypothetical protein
VIGRKPCLVAYIARRRSAPKLLAGVPVPPPLIKNINVAVGGD